MVRRLLTFPVLLGLGMASGAAIAQVAPPVEAKSTLPVEGRLPTLDGATTWIGSPALTAASLRGKVVLVDFWTYSCINSLRQVPFLRAWAQHYAGHGLVVIGVHSPEFAFEKNLENVRRAVTDIAPGFPVAVDSDHAVWQAFDNEYWPALYIVDGEGRIRHKVFGEGEYAETEASIRQLLTEAGQTNLPPALTSVRTVGVEVQADWNDLRTEETYVGAARAQRFVSPGGMSRGRQHTYAAPKDLSNGDWGLAGDWTVGNESALANGAGARIVFRFHARDVNLVMGPSAAGKPVRFHVLVDGKPVGADHGVDLDADGRGTVTVPRMYQLVRQQKAIQDRTVEIVFDDPGVQAYSFTFG
ncbi:Thiol-disulfide isomerase or thioredoxin [Luteibacter sp. UNCMF331Sha3.1]|uniref:thioredoxin-like domain-containing protein n=1 Tax=Luteibacter sp. UNCMF331Sha3.1 TaxID=1502760 RepID=UPI0008B687A3|nr:thioredoxin-like domain-containing protein [Luteibacter sp. UNCMF331Sha3.1]SEN16645.1 Thiol-disulfide isomerase or thioredoxin [Luteibacter sp. UNCMF331Sha3.1]